MNINDLKESLVRELNSLGVTKGRTVFVHSRLIAFKEAARHIPPKELPQFFLDCLLEAVGKQGTIVVPAFTTFCARDGQPFDLYHTPCDSGVFAEYVRSHPDSRRSLHPVLSISALGHLADTYTKGVDYSGYGWDSPFDRMTSEDTIVLCKGMTDNLSNSCSHYVEINLDLPYLYNKVIDYIPVTIDGEPVNRIFSLAVRYLDFNIRLSRVRHDAAIRESGIMRFATWYGGPLHAVDLKEYLALLKSEVTKDPYFLLENPPNFRTGECPANGPVKKKDK